MTLEKLPKRSASLRSITLVLIFMLKIFQVLCTSGIVKKIKTKSVSIQILMVRRRYSKSVRHAHLVEQCIGNLEAWVSVSAQPLIFGYIPSDFFSYTRCMQNFKKRRLVVFETRHYTHDELRCPICVIWS